MLDGRKIIETLGLQPHPEGGWYRETFREAAADGERGASTAIYFLLQAGEYSHWHRVDATEVWHCYAGAPLALTISENGHDAVAYRLGADILARQRPQIVVPENCWQGAESLGNWTLVGCTVAPAFEFSGFEMAPPDFNPR